MDHWFEHAAPCPRVRASAVALSSSKKPTQPRPVGKITLFASATLGRILQLFGR
jgi:hypothetical protein